MPYSAEHKLSTRQRILESARRLFNSKGFEQVSISEVMEGAGLTHGGFYRHFNTKEELYTEAVRWFLCADAAKPWQHRPRRATSLRRAQRVIDAYFSRAHFNDREHCCPLIGLPSDVARSPGGVRGAYQDVLEQLLKILHADLDGPERRERALTLVVLCIGGMVAARGVADPALARDLLSAAYRHAQSVLEAQNADVRHTLRHHQLGRRRAHRAPRRNRQGVLAHA